MTPTPDELKTCWNLNRGEMLECVSLEVAGRRKNAEARLAETPDLQRWLKAIVRSANSDFCTGKVNGGEGEPFIASFDWLIKPETLVFIEEGRFDSRIPHPPEDAMRSPKDLSYFDLEKDMRQLSAEEIRKLRIAGLAMKAWERERREWYGQKRSKSGERVGGDPMDVLVAWAFGKTQEVPGLVRNYGPPLDTPIKQLEEWMYLFEMPWVKTDEVPF